MKQEFYYPSQDGVTEIHAIAWKPESDIKGILQICHGMAEHMERYDEFAKYLCERGYYVIGHDHLGHGKSVQSSAEYGFFHETSGNKIVIGDIHKLRKITEQKYPKIPYYIMGHSMGSFLVRQYIKMRGKGLAGVIIMGTGYQPAILLRIGKGLCRIIALFKGWHYKSKLVYKMAEGSYNKIYKSPKTEVDWVTGDAERLQAYIDDPLCGFHFTVNAYYHMFTGMQTLTTTDGVENIPKNLPVFFVSGEEDPVGDCGKGVKKVYEKYVNSGMEHVSLKLYPGDRHEILNETDRQQVYEDLYEWLK
ncbi:MAG: alpha/beta hydrolase [Lachnospiraceae bacterium]